jgi:hypothetical protein
MKYDKYGKPIMEVAAQKPQTNTTAAAPLKTNTIAPQQKVAATQNIQPQAQQNTAAQTAQPEQTTDWAAEYDKVMQSNAANTSAQGVQAAQPMTSPAAQTALGSGASQWQAELDNVMTQIMNQGKFEYNMNGDAMYQQYADIYQNQANLGMQNAMAQAAAMTGGYGSSYGQMVGQQAYAQQMQGLNEIGMELYDRAYAQDQAERDRLLQQYSMLADREALGYNRDYQQSRDAAADSQWNQSFDYQKEQDKLAQSNYDKEFAYQQGRDSVADEQWNKQFAEQQAQNAADNKYREDAFNYQKDQDAINNKYRDDALAEDKRQYDESLNWQKDEYDKLYGEKGFYTEQNKADNAYRDATLKQNQDEFNSLYGYTDENGVYHEGYYDKEYDRMYGEEGYYTKQNAADNKYRDDALKQDQNQFNASMNWQREEYDKLYGENGYYTKQNAADNKYRDEVFGYQKEQDKLAQENWQKEFDREGKLQDLAIDQSKTTTKYEGEGDYNGKEVPKVLSGTQGLTTTNTNLFDDYGNLKQAAIVEVSAAEDGKDVIIYNFGGEEVSLRRGYSPYTNTKNPDANNGTFNGYQPNNVASYYDGDKEAGKLSKVVGSGTVMNGQTVDIYSTPDGKEWVYDAANNEYRIYSDPDKNNDKDADKDPIKNPTRQGGLATHWEKVAYN